MDTDRRTKNKSIVIVKGQFSFPPYRVCIVTDAPRRPIKMMPHLVYVIYNQSEQSIQ